MPRAAKVVPHEAEAVKLERVDGLLTEAAEPFPGVVEVRRPLREAETSWSNATPPSPRVASSWMTLR
jgi:hypothetical protein